jgi:hypothetical protein
LIFGQFTYAGHSGQSESFLGHIVKGGHELYDIISLCDFLITLEFGAVGSQFLDCLPKIYKEV